MPLHPQTATLLEGLAAAGTPRTHELTPDEARNGYRLLARLHPPIDEPEAVTELEVAGGAGPIPARRYEPAGDGPRPGLVWFHGGGWVIGDLETADPTCRSLCVRAGVVVISVDYRLAPEHPFPAAAEDAIAALADVHARAAEFGIDPDRLMVGGDSAGGNLAAVAAIDARDRGIRLRHQLLVYPVIDCTRSSQSYVDNAEGYLLTAATMAWFCDHYLGSASAEHPQASPIRAEDLSGLAPALVLAPEFDPLRDEGEAYAAALEAAGTPVECIRVAGQVHLYLKLTGALDDAVAHLDLIADGLRAASS